MVDLAIVEMLFDRHLQPSWTFPRPEVFLYLASALLTITIGIILGSTIRLTQRTKLARRIALEVAWPLCASIFILASTNAQQTLPGTLGLVPAYTFIGFAMLWLIAKVLRFIIGFLTDPDLLTARLTIWWKLAHVKRGTYQTAVRELHAKHGELIQVGPYEYSLSNPAYFERCAKFPKASPPYLLPGRTIQPKAFHLLREALKMANLFRYEADIEACNKRLMETFAEYARTGQTLKVSEVLACYAYDVLYATTTGQRSGFLDKSIDGAKIASALDNWKFLAVLYGSYLRLRPSIYAAIRALYPGANAEYEIMDLLDIDNAHPRSAAIQMLRARSDDPDHAQRTTEACIALVLAGSDPLITHLLTTLFYIYRDPKLLQRLRNEITRSGVWQPPSLKYLMRSKARFPLLHAVLQESLRLHQPQTTGFSYVAPEGGVLIGEKHVPEGCTICLEPSVAHVNPDIFGDDAEAWNPDRWLQGHETTNQMNRHMLAFGAGPTKCPGIDFHIAINQKLLVNMLTKYDFDTVTEGLCAVPNDISFNEMKKQFDVKVRIPKAGPSVSPSSPLRANAPAFAPETTTAPENPPGLTPRRTTFNPFTIAGIGLESFGNYLVALKGGKEFVPKRTDDATSSGEDTAGVPQGSPTFSNAPTLGSDHGISDGDKDLLGSLIGSRKTATLLERYPPAKEVLVPNGSVSSWRITKALQRAHAHEAIERIWNGRLTHQDHRASSRIIIELADPSALPSQFDKQAKPTPRQQMPAARPVRAEVHGAWTGFAMMEGARFDDQDAKDAKEARDREQYEEAKKKRGQEYEDLRAARASMAQPTFQQTFKQVARGAANQGKLGGPRKFVEVRETQHNGDGTVTVIQETTSAETAIELEKVVKPKGDAALPPHLRPRPVSPPPQGEQPTETNAIDNVVLAHSEVKPHGAQSVNISNNVSDTAAAKSDEQTHTRARSYSPPHCRSKSSDAKRTDSVATPDGGSKKHVRVRSISPPLYVQKSQEANNTVSAPSVETKKMMPEAANAVNTDSALNTSNESSALKGCDTPSKIDTEQTPKVVTNNYDTDGSETGAGGVELTGGDGWVAAKLPFL